MSNLPPPMPPAAGSPQPQRPQAIPGTEGMTLEELEQEVREGGRFVFYSYCISIIILTFRRSSGVRFLKRGQDGTASAFGYSLLAFLFGWWGIPWGPIYTIGALITNFRGGKDVTANVMAALMGDARAVAVVSTRRKPAPAGVGMMAFRAAMVAAPLAVAAPVVMGVMAAGKSDESRKKAPGYAAYDHANSSITRNVTGGNTQEARQLAEEINTTMKAMLQMAVETGKGNKTPNTNASVWCDCNEDRCVVLMKIPDLRKFDQDSQELIGETLWSICQLQLSAAAQGRPGMTLVAGLRGAALYDSVMVGKYNGDKTDKPAETLTHSEGVDRLVTMFNRKAPPAGAP